MRMTTAPDQLYEADFYAWTRQQALALRRFARLRPNLSLDLEHIAEEIQDLGKSERDTVYSLAQNIIEHILLIEPRRRHLKRDVGAVYGDGRWIVERKLHRYGEGSGRRGATCNLPIHGRAGPRRQAARDRGPLRVAETAPVVGTITVGRLFTPRTIPLPHPRRPASDRPARADCVGLEVRPCRRG